MRFGDDLGVLVFWDFLLVFWSIDVIGILTNPKFAIMIFYKYQKALTKRSILSAVIREDDPPAERLSA